MVLYNELVRYAWIVMTAIVVVLVIAIIYYMQSSKSRQGWEIRFIIVALLFAVHELTFFLEDPFINQLTELLFVIGLLYSLIYVFSFERKVREVEDMRTEFLKGLEEIRDLKEIREKLKK